MEAGKSWETVPTTLGGKGSPEVVRAWRRGQRMVETLPLMRDGKADHKNGERGRRNLEDCGSTMDDS